MNLLVVDIGNSDTVFGWWRHDATDPFVFRVETASILKDNLILKLALDLHETSIFSSEIDLIILCSVVPHATPIIKRVLAKHTAAKIKVLEQSQFDKLPIEVLKPDEIGTDLVANALAAYTTLHKDCIIVDFGTALSFTTVDRQGKIVGVSIAPGLQTALKALTAHTAQLQSVPLIMPPSALGKNTEQAIQTGILYGYDGLVRGIIKAQEEELNLQQHRRKNSTCNCL